MASVYSAPKNVFRRLWYEPPPSLGVEFSAAGIAAAQWAPGAGVMEQFDIEPLPEGALRASPVRENVAQHEEVQRVLRQVLERVTHRHGGNIALLLPDAAARVSVVNFEQLPQSPHERLPLIRWRLKKTVPFEIDDAALAYHRQGASAQGEELAIAVSPLPIIRQYEALVESLGFDAGFVTLSSLAALGLVSPAEQHGAGVMLIRGLGGLLTILVVSPAKIRVFRATELPVDERGNFLIEEIARHAYSSTVYYADNFQEKVERVFLADFGEQSEELRGALEGELGVPAQLLAVPGARAQGQQFLGLHGMVAAQAAAR
jgi:type IV pilus assembly protein PilM